MAVSFRISGAATLQITDSERVAQRNVHGSTTVR